MSRTLISVSQALVIRASVKARSKVWLTMTSVSCVKPKVNSEVSKNPISPSVSESCSGYVSLVDLNTDLQADWPIQTSS